MTTISIEAAPYNGIAVSPDLQAYIDQEIARQVAPVLEENQALRDKVSRQDDEIATLRERLGEVDEIEAEIADLRAETARERAFDRKRIATLEAEECKPKTVTSSPKASPHIEKLFDLMLQSGLRQVSVSNAAKMLGISRMHMHRLKATLGGDRRFVVVQDPHHRQRHLIRLV